MAKKMKKRKKSMLYIDIGIFSPRKIKEKYKEYSSPYVMQHIYIGYALAIICTIAVSYMFSFTIINSILSGLMFLFTAPVILISMQKCQYELKKFSDINSYMKQFTQSMRRSEKIATALIDTLEVFKDGEMKQTLQKAVDHLNRSWDVKISKVEALGYIEEKYGNSQLIMLHDFCLRAEEHGGDFKNELDMLSDMRDKWQKRNDTHQMKLKSVQITTIGVAIIFMALVSYILHGFPEMISIKEEPIVQFAELMYVGSFCFTLILLQNKRCSSILNDGKPMSLEEAEEAMDYIENFDRKKSGEKFRPMGLFVMIASFTLALLNRSITYLVFGIVAGGLFANLHHIIFFATKQQLKKEMENEFPKWLFDMCLLMQKDTVVNAISKSLYTAPPVLRREIRKLEQKLSIDPTNEYAFLDFLENYDMNEVVDTMRSLISMKKGTAVSNKVHMQQLISYNLNLLNERDKSRYEQLNAKAKLYMFIPFGFTIVIVIVYFIIMFLLIFNFATDIIK